ncbi:MAG: hypothetical protein V3S41_05345 [Spirochaetia bacterium]
MHTSQALLHTAAVLLQNGEVKKETSPEEYWAAIAEEVGEPVRAFALARLVAIAESERTGMIAPKPEWGLVYITNSALYIERGSTSSRLQQLFMTRHLHQAPERISIPVDSMTKVVIPPPKTGLRRILATPEIVVEIHHEGTPGVLRLQLDRRGTNDKLLIEILSGLMSGG